MLDPQIEKKARGWMGPEFRPEVREEIRKLFDSQSWDELTDRFYQDLEFGTGGIRGILGAGTNRINEYVIRMSTQGLANYILEQNGSSNLPVAIAHDPRHNGSRVHADPDA